MTTFTLRIVLISLAVSVPASAVRVADLPQDMFDLLREKKIEIETQGSGIQNVGVRIRKLVPYPIMVRVPIGSYFVSSRQSTQNMVTTAERKVLLTGDDWQRVSISAACANRSRGIPDSTDTFTIQRFPQQDELAKLMPVLSRSNVNTIIRQAAVWIVTDNADYSELGILVSGPLLAGGTRLIQEAEAARAMKICDEASIDITRKRIWYDRIVILKKIKDKSLKTWFEQKDCSLIGSLKDDSHFIRYQAAEAFRKVKAPGAVEPLIANLKKDTDSGVRYQAAFALGEIKDPRAVKPLIAALKDTDTQVRHIAAWALGELNDLKAVEPLIAALKDKERYVAEGAVVALGKLNDPRAVEPLIAASKDRTLRIEAFNALSQLKHPRAVEFLMAVFQDRNTQLSVRRQAAKVLEKLNDPRAEKALIAARKYGILHDPPIIPNAGDAREGKQGSVGLSAAASSLRYTEWPFKAKEAKRRQLETAGTLNIPPEKKVDIGNGFSMKFVLVPAGAFDMGSPPDPQNSWHDDKGPVRRVQITKAFYIGKFEVTQAQYNAVTGMNITASISKKNLPVRRVSWEEAMVFCRKVGGRLPTEAEWEYACRAGTNYSFYFGSKNSKLKNYAWYGSNIGKGNFGPHPVGKKKPNAWGLYDMHGNASEWCQDWYYLNYRNASSVDPKGPSSGDYRVCRGGSWGHYDVGCQSANRDSKPPNGVRNILTGERYDIGFRVVLDIN